MSRRTRISRIEEAIAAKKKAHQERRKRWAEALPIHAQRHAVAVAAIVLAGEPKIDEPLIRAWARTLRHYEIAIDPTTEAEQVTTAQRLFPIIVGKQASSSRFAEIFSKAPAWLLQFTRTVLDAWIIRFRLPEMKPNPNWGSAGFADAERWPLLPKGVLSAGEPIPHHDARHMSLMIQSIVPPIDCLPKDVDLFAPNDVPSHESGTILDDIDFAFSLDKKPEWSAYERRRMRKFLRRLSRTDWSDHKL
jgi:hypothetical protein